MARKKANTERINTFFTPETLAELKEFAEIKGSSVSGIIRMIVLEYLATHRDEKTPQ